jgi:arylsulfatase A-like enzyme
MAKQFEGKIELDVRDSVADWDAFTADKAPDGAPNVLVVLYDDTGCGAWSPYGGRIAMPTMDRLAANGLTYSQWHTTALCSPTRSTFLTGRNHHANGFASISESSTGFPGYSSHIPPENGTIAHVLRDAGYSTFWVGKNHNVPVDAWTQGLIQEGVAAGHGLRPLLRVHRRRDEQLVSEPGRGQPLHRAAARARGRLPPLQGPR